MGIAVFRVFSLIDGDLIGETPWPRQCDFRSGDVVGVLTNLPEHGNGDGPAMNLELSIGTGTTSRRVTLPLVQFLTAGEYRKSFVEPFSFAELGVTLDPQITKNLQDMSLRWLWLFRDAIYVTERSPRPSEMDEVVLRVKSLHFQRDEAFRRLREQVSNFEAIENNLKNGAIRKAIPDDVKLFVWSRDGGACVKCGASKDLHFDHIIPFSRGGSAGAENIQLLCRTCNLAKSDRLA
jgi:hypothetical protein